jgi:transposase InsO family protein
MESLGCANGLVLFNDNSCAVCEGYVIGKISRFPFGLGHEKASTPGQRIHSDICGPLQVATPGGNRFFVTLKDDYSGWCATRLLKNKSEVAVVRQDFVAHVNNQTGKEIKIIRSDNGGEYPNNHLKTGWQAKLAGKRSTPYTPQQNGLVERMNRTIIEAAKIMLHWKKVPLELWGKAVMCATHVLNRTI